MNFKKSIFYFIKLLIIEFPFFILNIQRRKIGVICSFIIYFIFCLYLYKHDSERDLKIGYKLNHPFFTLLFCFFSSFFFFIRRNNSNIIFSIAEKIFLDHQQTVLIITILLGLLSIFGINYAVNIIALEINKTGIIKNSSLNSKKIFENFFIFLTAFTTITINSECSPLYAFNNWVDPNYMFTVGKAVLKNYIPYRDLYEQKGPILLFMHTLGASISFTTFFGMYLIEILFAFVFLVFSYKTIRLFFKYDNKVILLIPLLSWITYSSNAFQNGDSAEEFCLPIILYSLYIGCKAILQQYLPSKYEFYWIGITSGFVLWSKYSMLGFYFGWFLFFCFYAIYNKCFIKLLSGIIYILCGIITITIPIFLYFEFHHAFDSLFEVYFYNNLFRYANSNADFFSRYSFAAYSIFEHNPTALFMSILGIIWAVVKKNKNLFAYLLTVMLSTFLFIYYGGLYYYYYTLIFSVFSVFGFCLIRDIIIHIQQKIKPGLPALTCLHLFSLPISMIGLCLTSENIRYMDFEIEESPQYKIVQLIKDSGIEKPTVLEYKTMATGVNTIAGLIPNTRFFCAFNIDLEEMRNEQDQCIKNQCVDFIVTESIWITDYEEIPNYEYVTSFRFYEERDLNLHFYHFYRKK